MEWAEIIGYGLALLIGGIMGLMGSGGSLIVPLMVYVFGKDITLATANALFLVGITAAFGVWRKWKYREVNISVALSFVIPIFLGTLFARLYLIHAIPDEFHLGFGPVIAKRTAILLIFAALLFLSFGSMVFRSLKPKANDEQKQEEAGDKNWPLLILLGLFIGTISSLVGSGGGVLVVPVLVLMLGLPIKVAAGTSLTMTAIKSLLGFTGDMYTLGDQLEWNYLLFMSVLMIIGIFIGTSCSRFFTGPKLRKAFAGLLLCMGLFILGQELGFFW